MNSLFTIEQDTEEAPIYGRFHITSYTTPIDQPITKTRDREYVTTRFDDITLVTSYFPKWPVDCKLELRSRELKAKDGRCHYCIGSRPNDDDLNGTIYQFATKTRCDLLELIATGPAEPFQASGADVVTLPNGDTYWTSPGGFRGLFTKAGGGESYVEIPCPIALQETLGEEYSIAMVHDLIGDLEYATLASTHDFVISDGEQFYHDMMGHVVFQLYERCYMEIRWRNPLRKVLEFYHNWKQDTMNYSPRDLPVIEFCLGFAADIGLYPDLDTLVPKLRPTHAKKILPQDFNPYRDCFTTFLIKHTERFFKDYKARRHSARDKPYTRPARLGMGYENQHIPTISG
jgi:hypothetical protein